MTDEQLEKVFAKMRGSLGDAIQDDMMSALEQGRAKMRQDGKDASSMPRAKALDENMRKKYGKSISLYWCRLDSCGVLH